MPRLHDTNESFTNEFGAALAEVKQASPTLRDLLSESIPAEYDSEIQADRATIANLRYWCFDEENIIEILKQYRPTQRNAEFILDLVQNTTLTEIDSICPSLGTALIKSGKQNDGRPKAGVATLRDIKLAFQILGEQTTASQIVESGFPEGDATQTRSVKKRVTRGLKLLERAGYVSHDEVGQLYVWYDEGISSLSLPNSHLEQLNL
jgi:hypothetical protein